MGVSVNIILTVEKYEKTITLTILWLFFFPPSDYENDEQESENFINCENLDNSKRDQSKVCKFQLDDLGDFCVWQKDYGYYDGEPCVLLKLNKVRYTV